MCGIAGAMTRDGRAVDPSIIDQMDRAIAHRGPDGRGRVFKDGVALSQLRLAIIDLATGDQPLYEPGGAMLVGNGEIYNHIELRAEMRGTPFRTQSDCEVPLFVYAREGMDFTARLRGMYALAIYDPSRKQLVLARDPFGIKPLYYAQNASAFAFASEPQALLAAGFGSRGPRPGARDELLQLKFTTGVETIFPGIMRVLPGETLLIERGEIVARRIQPALPQGGPRQMDEAEAIDAIDRALTDSVNIHQRSDVPYGLFLSGGIDSSAVLTLMAKLNSTPVVAFTAGFPGTNIADERSEAARLAKAVGADHHEVTFDEGDFWALAPKVAAAMDDPTCDYAILPTYKLAAAARGHLKVILCGEGGDELFAGYSRYRRARRPWFLFGRKPRSKGVFDPFDLITTPMTGWRDGLAHAEMAAAGYDRNQLQALQAADCAEWLPNDLLTKLDRCLMAHGIEGRTPFLDPVVADLAFRLPDTLKTRNRLGKYALRAWLQKALPPARAFAEKQGFDVPVAEWIARRGDKLGPLVARNPGIRAIAAPDKVEALFRRGGKRVGFASWSLLFYALWHRVHVEGLEPGPDVFQTLGD
jgi:asparagine synthase (glutamine-hydrolysing)